MRYELKYYVQECDLNQCLAVINNHPASFNQTFDPRFVNNIYLDSPDLNSWHESQCGTTRRKKYRIRWYGEWDPISSPVLEIKSKENQLGTKLAYPISGFDLGLLVDETERIKNTFGLPAHIYPSSSNCYLRKYYESYCGTFRITLDHKLMYGSNFYSSIRPTIASQWVIMELKYDLGDDDDADWIRQFIPFRRSKFSKYVHSFGIM